MHTALLTDHYELTMVAAALRDGTAQRRCVFEVFARSLPPGRRYGVVCGTGRLLSALAGFRFDAQTVAWLRSAGVVDESTARWLSDYRFRGDIRGYLEGECYFPYSPILQVEGTFADAVLLETLTLSILNHDSAVAAAASRMVHAAGERPCIEMGSRRTHESAAPDAARAAYLAGFASTSNLAAGQRFGIPTQGTSAHAFTLVHDEELGAFASQVATLGAGTTVLVDTFDVATAVRTAVAVAGTGLGAVRIDSGDLGTVARQVREQLDSLGAVSTRVVATSDLDEYAIAALADAPVDGYGVGTRLVTGSGAPTAGLVYKLVARESRSGEMEPVVKRSPEKSSPGGRKGAFRRLRDGQADAEVVIVGREPSLSSGSNRARIGAERSDAVPTRPRRRVRTPTSHSSGRPLQHELVREGRTLFEESLADARARHLQAVAELGPEALLLGEGGPVVPTLYREGSSSDVGAAG